MDQNVKEADAGLSILSPEETAAVHGGTGELGNYTNGEEADKIMFCPRPNCGAYVLRR
jgi:hypothetical protein